MEGIPAPWIKEVYTVVKMVKRLKTRCGRQKVWMSAGSGPQRCLAHSSLRELVPQDDGSWEEALLIGGV